MHYYIEITLIKNADISPYFIWSKLYTQLHLAFVELKDEQNRVAVGVSFPEYQYDTKTQKGFLGDRLRIFADTEDRLEQLNISKHLARLMDYVHIARIREVPTNRITGYVQFSRIREKGSVGKLSRRYAKYKNVSLEEAVQHYQSYKRQLSTLPFIQLKSMSNKEAFRLFIAKKIVTDAVSDHFNVYGLSHTASVPEFP